MGEARRPVEVAELHHGHVGVLVDYAVGFAGAGIALDPDGVGRVGGAAADPRGGERGGVGDGGERQDMAPEPPDRTDIDRIVGRYAVKLPARREALFGEVGGHVPVIGRLADRHGDDPFARLRLGDQRRDPREHVVDRPAARERGENRLQPLAVEMRVPIDQARHDRSAAGVDAHGVRPDQRFDFGGGADGGNPVARHRDGIGDRALPVDRDRLAPGDREVGGRGHQAPTA